MIFLTDENIETSLEDAEWHLDMARNADEEDAPARIVVSYCVLSLIRAADALCWHYTGDRCQSGRGHDLHNEFENLYTHNDLPESFATYKERLRKWVKQEKSEAQYKGARYSTSEVSRCIRETEEFLENCVKAALRQDGIEIRD